MPTGVYERKSERYTFDCLSCGSVVDKQLSAYKGRKFPKFCSAACFGESLKIAEPNRTCGHCQAGFRGRQTSKFCSAECRSASRRISDARWRDPDYVREYRRQYALKKRAAGEYDAHRLNAERGPKAASKEQISASLEKAMGRCVYCGEHKERLTIDHATPIHSGGKHNIKNLIPCCKSCNSSKGTKDLSDWLFDKHGIDGLARAYTFIVKRKINEAFYEQNAR